jgi:hypothetical protein
MHLWATYVTAYFAPVPENKPNNASLQCGEVRLAVLQNPDRVQMSKREIWSL